MIGHTTLGIGVHSVCYLAWRIIIMYAYIYGFDYVLADLGVQLMIDVGAVMIMMLSALPYSAILRGT